MSHPLHYMRNIAETVRDRLAPHCERIEIAGSIRREKPMCGDIEIVCIPKHEPICDLFGDVCDFERSKEFCRIVAEYERVKGYPEGKYTQRKIAGEIKLDLFMATPQNWGLIFAIRTGSADFSHSVLAKGWVAKGWHCKDGMLTKEFPSGHVDVMPIEEEEQLFAWLGLNWIPPKHREL